MKMGRSKNPCLCMYEFITLTEVEPVLSLEELYPILGWVRIREVHTASL